MTCNRQSVNSLQFSEAAVGSGSGSRSRQQQAAAAGGNSYSNNGVQQSVSKETSNIKQTATKTGISSNHQIITSSNQQFAIRSGSRQQQAAAAGGNSYSNNGDQQSVSKETSNIKQTATKTGISSNHHIIKSSNQISTSNKRRLRLVYTSLFFLVLVVVSGCKINYTFTGASVSPAVKTFSVDFFTNNAPLFQPTLSQTFTEGLKDKLSSQTRLNLVSGGGDLQFEGEITNYSSGPISVQSAEMASVNRLTISVKVKFTNSNDPKQSYDRVFTQYEDYPATSSLSSVEGELIDKIVAKLTEDIFNKSLANW